MSANIAIANTTPCRGCGMLLGHLPGCQYAAIDLLRSGILAMKGDARIRWADQVREFLKDYEPTQPASDLLSLADQFAQAAQKIWLRASAEEWMAFFEARNAYQKARGKYGILG